MKKTISKTMFLIIILAIASNTVFADDLSNYPDFFVDDDSLDVTVVVGNGAPASHVIAQTQIILSLTNFIGKRVLGLSKLSSDIDEIDDANLISIGNACDNEISAEILGNPEPCDLGLDEGKATIEFFESGKNVHIVVNALTDKGIKKAAAVLSNYELYDFKDDVFETIVFEEEQSEEKAEEEVPIIINDVVEEVIKIEEPEKEPEEKIEFEESKPEPILKDEDNIIMKIISWLRSLFGK